MNAWNRYCCWPFCCTCGSKPTPAAGEFSGIKSDEKTGLPLAGAEYILYRDGSQIASSISDASGKVFFSDLAPGEYDLIERVSPPGYKQDMAEHKVAVSVDGTVTIDGKSGKTFLFYDEPIPEAAVSFRKIDSQTGQPLAGAVFALPNGVSATSGSDGMVHFGTFAQGTYTIREISAPEGYEPEPVELTIVVAADGSITINGAPMNGFTVGNRPVAMPSQPPVIHAVMEGSSFVTGDGVPGAEIQVDLPDGTVVRTTVTASGVWVAAVPQGMYLQVGETISVTQTEVGHTPSEDVVSVILRQSE